MRIDHTGDVRTATEMHEESQLADAARHRYSIADYLLIARSL